MGIVRAPRTAWPQQRSRLALLAGLIVPCLLALLIGWPIAERPAAESQADHSSDTLASASSPRERAPDALPLGLVWGGCCASLIALGLLSVSVRRRAERRAVARKQGSGKVR